MHQWFYLKPGDMRNIFTGAGHFVDNKNGISSAAFIILLIKPWRHRTHMVSAFNMFILFVLLAIRLLTMEYMYCNASSIHHVIVDLISMAVQFIFNPFILVVMFNYIFFFSSSVSGMLRHWPNHYDGIFTVCVERYFIVANYYLAQFMRGVRVPTKFVRHSLC